MIVQNQALPGDTIDVSPGAILTFRQFVNYELKPNQTLTGAGLVRLEHTFSNTDLLVSPTSAVRGNLIVRADNVVNSGLIAPGFSPGIIKIDGDYTQENDGTLEIEVGGLTPGDEHDQLQVTGFASLGGRLEVPILDGYQPQLNDSITILTATEVEGQVRCIVLAKFRQCKSGSGNARYLRASAGTGRFCCPDIRDPIQCGCYQRALGGRQHLDHRGRAWNGPYH